MTKKAPPKIVFIPVKDNPTKLSSICQRAAEALKQEKRLLIWVPNEESARYIDALLWRTPEESFVPHLISQSASKAWITITTAASQNLNEASWLLNLCPQISPLYLQFEEIYEFLDQTHPQKTELSQQKIKEYQLKGLIVTEK